MATIVKRFDSVRDLLAEVTDTSRPIKSGLRVTSQDRGREEFFWTETFSEAVDLARGGWAEGTAKIVEHREACSAFLAAAKTAKTREFGWDVTGDFIDVGRLLSGEPECCGSEFDGGNQIASRVVSIRLNQSVSGGISADTICARGVTVLVAVDLLESCGVRCEVTVSKGSKGTGCAGSVRNLQVDSHVVVKQAGDAVDLDKLAFWVAHPASFRRLGFRLNEQNGLSPCGAHPARLSDYGADPNVIEIDEILSGASLSKEELQANVLAIAKACGLEFDDETVAAITTAN
jgi:hypothetical protein